MKENARKTIESFTEIANRIANDLDKRESPLPTCLDLAIAEALKKAQAEIEKANRALAQLEKEIVDELDPRQTRQ